MITFINPAAELYYPSNAVKTKNLGQTTHLGIGAHQDDLEIIAIHGILEAFDDPGKKFTGVTVTDGRGAPRSGPYATLSDDDLHKIRCDEQKKAADLGNYHAQYLLNYPSQAVKTANRRDVIEDLIAIIKTTSPTIIYTHNLADKHDTHIGVALSVIQALREVSPLENLTKLYGCEAWRDLDWLVDDDKIALDVSSHPDLQERLVAVFKSQIAGGKRYDLATIGRRQAHATYYQSHQTDTATRMVFAIDMTPLINDPEMEIEELADRYINNFAKDVRERLRRLRTDTARV
jgi:LmbE family N-acetylglucosaminyl deacetylase